MATFTIQEAEDKLDELLGRIQAGEEIVITRDGKPVAVLKSYHPDDIAHVHAAG